MTTQVSSTGTDRRALKRTDPGRVGFGRLLAWSSSHASTAANFLITGYFTIYCTDTLGLPAGIIGALLLVSKIVDAVGVLVAGYLVDRSPETRFGKARPYELALVGIWIFTALMFSTPAGWGEAAKLVWVFVTYLLVTAVFGPLFNANQPLFMARAFATRDAYTKVSTTSGIVIGAVAVAAGISFPIFAQQAGKSPAGWSALIIAYAVPLTLFGLLRFLFIREQRETEVGLPRVTVRDVRTVLASNPYLWAVAGIQLIVAIGGSLGALTYYYRYIVGSLALQGVLGLLAVILLPAMLVFPRLVKRFSVSKLIAAAAVVGIVGPMVYLIAGRSVPLLVLAALLTAIASLPTSFLLPILVIDNATFNEWKGNRRLESVGGGVTAFAQNLGAGIAGGLTGLVLALVGYDGTRNVQSAGATAGIVALNSWIPALFAACSIFLALAYHRFEKRLPEITADIERRRAEAAEPVPLAPTASGIAAPVLTGAEPLQTIERDLTLPEQR